MKSLRLLVTKNYNRNCKLCCNKSFDLNNPKYIFKNNYSDYKEIILTGGEPLLYPIQLIKLIKKIRMACESPIFIYTAYSSNIDYLIRIIILSDGITFTIHEEKDIDFFYNLSEKIIENQLEYKSLRLNIFDNIRLKNTYVFWEIKNIKWLKNCPIPKNEDFKVLNPGINKIQI
jgi:organic radical activating enzyme